MSNMITRRPKRDSDYMCDSGVIDNKQNIYSMLARRGAALTFGSVASGKPGKQKINGYVSSNHRHGTLNDPVYVYGFVVEKVRRKTRKMKVRVSKSAPNGVRVQVINRHHWKFRIYRFPIEDVLTFEQGSRTFKVTLRSV